MVIAPYFISCLQEQYKLFCPDSGKIPRYFSRKNFQVHYSYPNSPLLNPHPPPCLLVSAFKGVPYLVLSMTTSERQLARMPILGADFLHHLTSCKVDVNVSSFVCEQSKCVNRRLIAKWKLKHHLLIPDTGKATLLKSDIVFSHVS